MKSDESIKEPSPAAACAGPLDLGLGSLLEPSTANGAGSAVPEAEPESPSREDREPSILGTLRSHGDRSEWREIVTLCEAEPAHGQNAHLVRAWWLKAQLALADLPLAVLIAPLDSLSDVVERETKSADSAGNSELLGIVIPLIETVVERLTSEGELDYAIALLERLSRIAAGDSRSVVPLVGKVRSRVPAGDQLRRSRLDALVPERGLLDQLASPIAPSPLKESSKPILSVGPAAAPRITRLSRLVVVGALVALVCGSGTVYYFASSAPEGSGRTPTLRIDYAADLLSVASTPIAAVRQLDTLMQDMARARTDLRGVLPEKSTPPTAVASAGAESVGTTVATPSRRAEEAVGSAPVQLNTKTPLEPSEVREALSRPPAREPNIMDLAQPAGRRRVETPQSTGPGVYRVIARTDVLSRPTYRSYRVAVLVPGDKIQVDEDMGSWLRLKSRNGRPGYILAQDAVRDGVR